MSRGIIAPVRRVPVRLPAAAVLALLLVAGCGSSKEDSSTKSVKVGYGYGYGSNHAADKIAFAALGRAGMKARIVELGGPSNAITGVDRGDLQLANLAMGQVLEAIAQGAKLKIVLPVNSFGEFALVTRPGITRASQLRGKTVLISTPHNQTTSFIERILKQAGVPVSSVKFPALLDSSSRIVALQHGKADAALLEQLDVERLGLTGKHYTVVGRITDVQPPGPSSVWIMSDRFIDDHPDETQTIVNALVDAYRSAYTAKGRAAILRESEASDLKGQPELAKRIYAWYRAHGYWPRGGVFGKQAYDRLVAYWLSHEGMAPPAPPYEKAWNTRFWSAALSR